MKKISVMLTALATALAFTACDESKDDHPTINTHEGEEEAIFLNTPEMSNMAVQITEDNQAQTLHMTCSQPDYGFAAQVQYQVEVSLNNFSGTPMVEGCPASMILDTSFTDCSEINPVLGEIAQAMCKMLNIESDSQVPTDYYPLYMRLIANVKCVTGTAEQLFPNTTYISNTVQMQGVSCGYLAIVVPGLPTGIYLRGDMNDWGTPSDAEFLTTSESGVYEIANYEIKAGQGFKVADSSWANPNCGTNGSNPKFNESYTLDNSSSSGNIYIDSDFNGRIQLTVKGGSYVLLLEAAEPDTPGLPSGIYVRGDFNGWGADADSEFLTTDYKNNWRIDDITITAGTFKIADANWGSVNLGVWDDTPIALNEEVLVENGGGNITLSSDFTGQIDLKVKGGLYYVKLTPSGE